MERADGAVLLRTRPASGLLGGMAEPPGSEWRTDFAVSQAVLEAPLDARWKKLPGIVRHVFTHFPLELTVFYARVAGGTPAPDGMRFVDSRSLSEEPFPSVMKKVLAHAFEARSTPMAKS